MPAQITAQDAITAVHEAAQLGRDTGLTVATLQAMTGLDERHLLFVLNALANRSAMSELGDGRWIAWPVCPTCGHGLGGEDPYDFDVLNHPGLGICKMPPAGRCAGYPITTA